MESCKTEHHPPVSLSLHSPMENSSWARFISLLSEAASHYMCCVYAIKDSTWDDKEKLNSNEQIVVNICSTMSDMSQNATHLSVIPLNKIQPSNSHLNVTALQCKSYVNTVCQRFHIKLCSNKSSMSIRSYLFFFLTWSMHLNV